jgi:hypothetical protein
MLFASLVRLLRVPLPLRRIALPKKGDEIAATNARRKNIRPSIVTLLLTSWAQNAFSKKMGRGRRTGSAATLAAQYSGGD